MNKDPESMAAGHAVLDHLLSPSLLGDIIQNPCPEGSGCANMSTISDIHAPDFIRLCVCQWSSYASHSNWCSYACSVLVPFRLTTKYWIYWSLLKDPRFVGYVLWHAFFWMEITISSSKYYLNMVPGLQSVIILYSFSHWLGAEQATGCYLKHWY